jgi:glycogen synthase
MVMSRSRSSRPKVREVLLVIAGRRPLADDSKAQTSRVRVQANVRLPLPYRGATLSVVPAATLESFGLVTIGSLAAGTPVMTTPGGRPPEVNDLAPGMVLASTSSPALAEGLLAALNGALPFPSAQACEDCVRVCFDWPVIAARGREPHLEVLA